MKYIKSIWKYLNGKKTIIAATYWTVVEPSIVTIWPDGAPKSVIVITTIIGIVFSILGLGHKSVKYFLNNGEPE